MRRRAALLAAVFLRTSSGLRLEATQSSSLPSEGEAAKLPTPEVFEALWKGDMQKEPRGVPFLKEVQLVLGVFATAADDPRIREVIRRTWMDQPGVCMLNGGQKPHCSIYTAFVLGTTSSRRYSEQEFVLNVSENMNSGKSFYYFREAAKSFPWATHIVKMDLDTFPYLGRLTESLRKHVGSHCEHYFGQAMDYGTCGGWEYCPPKECSTPVGGDFLKYGLNNSRKCWSYMGGALYGMSASLARSLTVQGGTWSKTRLGHEDRMTGRAVGSYARKKNICVSTWNPLAWDHVGPLSSIDKVKFSNGTVVWKHRNSVFDE